MRAAVTQISALPFERSERRPRRRRRLRRARVDARRRRDARPPRLRAARARRRRRDPPLLRPLGLRRRAPRLVGRRRSSWSRRSLLLLALGLSGHAVLGAGLLVAGIAIVAARGGSLRPGGSLPVAGDRAHDGRRGRPARPRRRVGLASSRRARSPARSLLVLGPWLWQLAAERTERIRLAERAEVAARIHDSVLQTLALVQRARRRPRARRRARAPAGARAAPLALRQRLRRGRHARRRARRRRRRRRGAARRPDRARDRRRRRRSTTPLGQLVLAAREAMTNAAKFSGADEISVYAEVDDDGRRRLRPRPRRRLRPRRRRGRPARDLRVDRGAHDARRRHARRSPRRPARAPRSS